MARKQVPIRRRYRGAHRTRSTQQRSRIENYLLLIFVPCVSSVLLMRCLLPLPGYAYLYSGLIVFCMVALLTTLGALHMRSG